MGGVGGEGVCVCVSDCVWGMGRGVKGAACVMWVWEWGEVWGLVCVWVCGCVGGGLDVGVGGGRWEVCVS